MRKGKRPATLKLPKKVASIDPAKQAIAQNLPHLPGGGQAIGSGIDPAVVELERVRHENKVLRAMVARLGRQSRELQHQLLAERAKQPLHRKRGRPRKEEAEKRVGSGRVRDDDAFCDAMDFAHAVNTRSDKETKPRLQIIKAMLKERAEKDGKRLTEAAIDQEAVRLNAQVSRMALDPARYRKK